MGEVLALLVLLIHMVVASLLMLLTLFVCGWLGLLPGVPRAPFPRPPWRPLEASDPERTDTDEGAPDG